MFCLLLTKFLKVTLQNKAYLLADNFQKTVDYYNYLLHFFSINTPNVDEDDMPVTDPKEWLISNWLDFILSIYTIYISKRNLTCENVTVLPKNNALVAKFFVMLSFALVAP